ncbi:PcfB family protein [Anaeropeptidivorans aminofermentans]|uniref:PcfB family protein n=1 Tax=Anaeropeptidivorans aminofermentans TaxID=2934315 RepID=UPI002024EA1D|nr:PcfB family protein [Anaeropeptidivorans aminofermentans]
MLHEEVNRESLQLGAKIGKLTAEEIKKALDKLLAQLTELKKNGQQLPTVVHGKQSLKELSAQNTGLSSMELKDPNLRQINREMKKAGIDFSPVKTGKGEYLLFFKGRDADAMTHAFNQYTKKLVKQAEKPSIRKVLSDFKEKAAAMNAQRAVTKNKDKGIEL